MKVLHINCNYIYTTLHQIMIEQLDKFGLENSVFVPVYDKNSGTIAVNGDVTVTECFKKWDRLLFNYKSRKIRKAAEKLYDISTFDMIHAYTLFTDGNVAYRLHSEYGIPYVVAIRNTDVNDFLKHMIYLRPRAVEILENAEAVFFLSKAYRSEVFQKYIPAKQRKAIAEKTYVIPNGIDDFWFDNLYTERKPYTGEKPLEVIYAGVIDSNKNIETTQKALDILRLQGIESHFTVVGKVIERDVFERIKADPHTTYVEAQPKEKLITYYRAADIFVMPSHKETFGLVYAEAMSQGLPVIYTKGQGFDGQFEEGVVGYHVDDQNPDDVAKSMAEVINNKQIVSLLFEKVNKFRWEYICRKYMNIYGQHGK